MSTTGNITKGKGITKLYSADIFVSDVDRAIDFYVNKLGFTKRTDEPMDEQGHRWVEVALPGSDTAFILAHGFGYWSADKVGGYSGLMFSVDDMASTFELLKARGVTFKSDPDTTPYGIFAEVADPDGNTFMLHDPAPMLKAQQGEDLMKHEPTKGLYGWITHTDFASRAPEATKNWCTKVLGWDFKSSFPVAGGEYHLFAYSNQGGGGISPLSSSESPSCTPFVHVENTQEAFNEALQEGAEVVTPPIRVMEGVTTAVVRAPGDVLIGFSGP